MLFLEMFKDHRKGQLRNWISVENRAVSTVDQAIKNGWRPCRCSRRILHTLSFMNACRSAVVARVQRLRENMLLMLLNSECDTAIGSECWRLLETIRAMDRTLMCTVGQISSNFFVHGRALPVSSTIWVLSCSVLQQVLLIPVLSVMFLITYVYITSVYNHTK